MGTRLTPGQVPLRAVEASDEWETPPDLFAELDAEWSFTLDAAAIAATAKCPRFLTPDDDALAVPWHDGGLPLPRIWLNPPYGRALPLWVAKARLEASRGAFVVLLIPARLDTRWWHDIVARSEVRFLRGRVKFLLDGVVQPAAGPFPVAVVVMRPGDLQRPAGARWWAVRELRS
jgi:phage N-6-adenine-methyltransferase